MAGLSGLDPQLRRREPAGPPAPVSRREDRRYPQHHAGRRARDMFAVIDTATDIAVANTSITPYRLHHRQPSGRCRQVPHWVQLLEQAAQRIETRLPPGARCPSERSRRRPAAGERGAVATTP